MKYQIILNENQITIKLTLKRVTSMMTFIYLADFMVAILGAWWVYWYYDYKNYKPKTRTNNSPVIPSNPV